jgi:F0F1-type ATP synthase alpha subunit
MLSQIQNKNQEVNAQTEQYTKNFIFQTKHFGKVIRIKDGVAFVVNLKNVTFGELVLFIPSPVRLKKYRDLHQKT